jgi:hypothetical protein
VRDEEHAARDSRQLEQVVGANAVLLVERRRRRHHAGVLDAVREASVGEHAAERGRDPVWARLELPSTFRDGDALAVLEVDGAQLTRECGRRDGARLVHRLVDVRAVDLQRRPDGFELLQLVGETFGGRDRLDRFGTERRGRHQLLVRRLLEAVVVGSEDDDDVVRHRDERRGVCVVRAEDELFPFRGDANGLA